MIDLMPDDQETLRHCVETLVEWANLKHPELSQVQRDNLIVHLLQTALSKMFMHLIHDHIYLHHVAPFNNL